MACLESGLIRHLADRGLIIDTTLVAEADRRLEAYIGPRGERPELILSHPRVPFVSYPYEWTFGQLRDAAIVQLDLQIEALDFGFALSDATPYNMQFLNGSVRHIDVLSLARYRKGQAWAGYNQFCRLFLLPLLLEAWRGIAFQPFLRGNLEGIDLSEGSRLLPKRKLALSINGLMHVVLHARAVMASDAHPRKIERREAKLPKDRYRAILSSIRDWVGGLSSGRRKATPWNAYSTTNTYTEAMRTEKEAFVRTFVGRAVSPIVWDIGGNVGDYSCAALSAGARLAVVFDSDLDSLEHCYQRRLREKIELLPIVMDAANPSPSMGWNQAERRGLNERGPADVVLGLALLHHLVISRNVPLREAMKWLMSLAPSGIIEFVPKSDPMVVSMLATRDDLFDDYDERVFRSCIEERARIVIEHRFAKNNRLLIGFDGAKT
jgi:hypothetical protein